MFPIRKPFHNQISYGSRDQGGCIISIRRHPYSYQTRQQKPRISCRSPWLLQSYYPRCGEVINICCLAFITFLWFAGNSNSVWFKITHRGRIPASVTLAAMPLRWTVTTQAAISVSQLASLLLEYFQICPPDAPGISLLTSQSNGPLSMLWFIRTLRKASFVARGLLIDLSVTTSLL